MEKDSNLLKEFIVEAMAHIAEMEAGLLRMEEIEEDDGIINELFRAAHSIKGTAGFFTLTKIVDLAHTMETLFGELRDHRVRISSKMIDVLLAATDKLKELLDNPAESKTADISDHVTDLRRFLKEDQKNTDSCCKSQSAWDLWNQLTSCDDAAIESSEEIADDVACPAPVNVVSAPPVSKVLKNDSSCHEFSKEDSVRVHVGVLDDLLNLAGEIVLRRNQLLRITQDSDCQLPQLEAVSKGIDELTTKLQKKVMQARMQPIANVFNRFPRLVRDLSRKVGKEVDLVMEGMAVELDRSLVEALIDPLTHLVRNALDHGIEPAEVRQVKNKPEAGSLILRASQRNGRVIVEVCDDGAGIDLEKVKIKALERGGISQKDITAMRDTDIINLILTPGFSTAEKITDISGRGVGMDVVKTNIEKLGGKIEIASELGEGTTVRLILPLTLAIISSVIVIADGQSLAIPQANVRELLLLQGGEARRKQVEVIQNRPVLRLRGRLLPLVRLRDVLFTQGSIPNDDYYLDTAQTLRILVIKAGNSAYGLVVDSVYDTEEILVKPISTLLGSSGPYSGTTVLGDGSIAMIIDTERLAFRADINLDIPQSADVKATKNIDEERQYLLLFKCSGGELLGLDLAMVSRIEKVDISQLQKVGSKYYLPFQGQTIRVIRPEHYLPISRKKNKLSKIYVILPKLVKFPIGIVAEQIYDSVFTKVDLDNGGVCGKGILGSTLINNDVVTLLNIHELFAEAVPEYNWMAAQKRTIGRNNDNETDQMKKNTILLVEDTQFFLRLVKGYLESEGFEVITAENGREALQKLQQVSVDAVVSDIEMPVMSGIELVRAIRADDNLRQLPVIALTSLAGEVNKEKGLRAGFDLYEFKLDKARLLERVNEVLRKRA